VRSRDDDPLFHLLFPGNALKAIDQAWKVLGMLQHVFFSVMFLTSWPVLRLLSLFHTPGGQLSSSLRRPVLPTSVHVLSRRLVFPELERWANYHSFAFGHDEYDINDQVDFVLDASSSLEWGSHSDVTLSGMLFYAAENASVSVLGAPVVSGQRWHWPVQQAVTRGCSVELRSFPSGYEVNSGDELCFLGVSTSFTRVWRAAAFVRWRRPIEGLDRDLLFSRHGGMWTCLFPPLAEENVLAKTGGVSFSAEIAWALRPTGRSKLLVTEAPCSAEPLLLPGVSLPQSGLDEVEIWWCTLAETASAAAEAEAEAASLGVPVRLQQVSEAEDCARIWESWSASSATFAAAVVSPLARSLSQGWLGLLRRAAQLLASTGASGVGFDARRSGSFAVQKQHYRLTAAQVDVFSDCTYSDLLSDTRVVDVAAFRDALSMRVYELPFDWQWLDLDLQLGSMGLKLVSCAPGFVVEPPPLSIGGMIPAAFSHAHDVEVVILPNGSTVQGFWKSCDSEFMLERMMNGMVQPPWCRQVMESNMRGIATWWQAQGPGHFMTLRDGTLLHLIRSGHLGILPWDKDVDVDLLSFGQSSALGQCPDRVGRSRHDCIAQHVHQSISAFSGEPSLNSSCLRTFLDEWTFDQGFSPTLRLDVGSFDVTFAEDVDEREYNIEVLLFGDLIVRVSWAHFEYQYFENFGKAGRKKLGSGTSTFSIRCTDFSNSTCLPDCHHMPDVCDFPSSVHPLMECRGNPLALCVSAASARDWIALPP